MTPRRAIRAWLSEQDGPKWACEIIAAVVAMGHSCNKKTLHYMQAEGHLIRHSDVAPFSYTLGRSPRAKRTADELARHAVGKALERVRRSDLAGLRKDARMAATERASKPRGLQLRKIAALPLRSGREVSADVAEYTAKGGLIEVLPGFTGTVGYLPRRPGMAPGVRVAP